MKLLNVKYGKMLHIVLQYLPVTLVWIRFLLVKVITSLNFNNAIEII